MAGQNNFKQFQRQAKAYLRGVPKLIGKYVLLEVSNNFRQQGAEDETGQVVPWAPRKNDRKGKKRRRDGSIRGRATLVKTGRLRRSPRIVSSTATSVTVGTDVAYAEPLQEGTVKMPARPFLTAGPSTRAKIIRRVAGDITKLLGR